MCLQSLTIILMKMSKTGILQMLTLRLNIWASIKRSSKLMIILALMDSGQSFLIKMMLISKSFLAGKIKFRQLLELNLMFFNLSSTRHRLWLESIILLSMESEAKGF